MSNVIDEFIASVESACEHDQEIEMYQLVQALTLDVICRTALGVNYGLQKDLRHPILGRAKAFFDIKIDLLFMLTSK